MEALYQSVGVALHSALTQTPSDSSDDVLVGDWEAAHDVQLQLPESGVLCIDSVGGGVGCCDASVNTGPLSFSNLIPLDSIPVSGIVKIQ